MTAGRHIPYRVILLVAAMVVAGVLIHSCSEDPQLWKVASQEQVMGEYIANHPEQFSEFQKLVEATGMESLLNVRGPFTLFLPSDEAMLDYYMFKDVHSLGDFSESFLKDLILTHIVPFKISANDIGLGTLPEKNALGDFLVTEFQESDIILSKGSKIIKRDISAANGIIHIIDKLLDPVTKDINEIICSDPSYKIFSEGLRMTGLKDTLQLISFPYGISVARTRFTVLAVADTIYQRYGIHNVQELVEWTGANPDSIKFLDNPFYRYMEYHCLQGTYYLSDLNTGIYPILSRDNNISVTIDSEDYKINFNKKTGAYTGIIIPASNIPAKNGALHAINDILPVTEPESSSILFETTDFFDLKQGDYYLNYFMRFFDGENTFAKIKWEGDYLLYYYNPPSGSFLNNTDCLSTIGWWWISITFPKVMKGKYEVYIYQPAWFYVSTCAVYLDGEPTGYTYRGSGAGNSGTDAGLQKVADVDFPTTAEHTVTLRSITNGILFWDYVCFVPVK
jgi:uncharacterized surface protein with fasciclin (FAS1) repeats